MDILYNLFISYVVISLVPNGTVYLHAGSPEDSSEELLSRAKRQAPGVGSVEIINSTAIPGYIAQTVELNVTALFKAVDENFTLTISSPVSGGSALAFLNWVSINKTGPNLAALENRTLTLLSSDVVSFSQVVTLNYNLGNINNIVTENITIVNQTMKNETVCTNVVNETALCSFLAGNETLCNQIVGNETCNQIVGNEACNQIVGNETVCNLTMANETVCDEIFGNLTYTWNETVCNQTSNLTLVNITVVNTTNVVDEIQFTVSVLVADHDLNTQDSLIDISATLTGDLGTTASGIATIEVQTTGNEFPELRTDFDMESFNYWEKMSGDNVTCEGQAYLLENSTAHARDVELHVMTPYYAQFGSLLNVTGTNVIVTSSNPEIGFNISISEIDFRDEIYFSFNFVLDPARQMPLSSVNIETVVPVELTYRGPVRGDRVNTGVLNSGLHVHEFGFNTDAADALGIEAGTILDCQLTASSSIDTNLPSDGRLNTGDGWKPLLRGSPFCGHEYIQVDVGASAFITDIQLQSSTEHYSDIVTSFTLAYSGDALAWTDVWDDVFNSPKVFTIVTQGSGHKSDVYDVTLNVTDRFTARYVRLMPVDDVNCIIGLRMELKGTKQTAPPVNCGAIPMPIDVIPKQSYVVNFDTGTIFICGLSGVDGEVLCSRSDELGAYWQPIDNNVANIVAVITNTSIVIGMASDNTSYLVSEDDGITWDIPSDEQLLELQSDTGYVPSLSLPYDDYRDLSESNLYNGAYGLNGVYGPGGDEFKLTGVMEGVVVKPSGGSWTRVAYWGTDDWSLLD